MRLRSVPYKWLVAVGFVAGLFMDLLDATIVNVALPTLGHQFHAANTALEWVVTGYLLSLAVWIPASGWIGDRIGTKKTFLFALATFMIGSALCGLAWSLGALIAFRLLQGVGGGMLTPVGTAMLFRAFPPQERARASAILTVPAVLAPALGPVLGGLLVDDVTWRAIFYANLPIGLFGFIWVLLFVKEHTEPATGPFDVSGFVFSGSGLALALYALSQGPIEGWLSAQVLSSGLASIALLGAFIATELRVQKPMLDLRLLADHMFRTANLVYFAVAGSLFSFILLFTLFLQQLRGLSALQSGLTGFPQALGIIAGAPIVGRLYPRIGPRRLIVFGLLAAAATSMLFLAVDLETGLWWVRGLMFLRGLAFACCLTPVQTATFATISAENTGRASSFSSTTRQVATSVFVAALITVLTTRTAAHLPTLARASVSVRAAVAQHASLLGFHDAFAASALIALAGIAFALLIRDEDAAATMRPRSKVAAELEPAPVLAEARASLSSD